MFFFCFVVSNEKRTFSGVSILQSTDPQTNVYEFAVFDRVRQFDGASFLCVLFILRGLRK